MTKDFLLNYLQKKEPNFYLAMVCMFKNEAPYLNEWISFHLEFGVEHFYLLDDGSTDNYLEILKPFLDSGIITIVHKKWKNQFTAYDYAIRKWRNQCQWLAFNDVDEFLYSPRGIKLTEVLKDYEKASAVFVYWKLFGSGGHVTPPQKPVVESFLYSMSKKQIQEDNFDHKKNKELKEYVSGWSLDGKSIVNPRAIKKMGAHKPIQLKYGKLVDENFQQPQSKVYGKTPTFEKLRINHYWSKSIQEFERKLNYGSIANRNRPKKNKMRWLEREKMLNYEYDDTILQALKKLEHESAI